MSMILDLYYEKCKPFGERNYDSPEYIQKVGKMLSIDKEILALYPDSKELLDRYQEASMALSDIAAFEDFQRGFRFGARMMMEAMKPIQGQKIKANSGGAVRLDVIFQSGLQLLS